jgi:hypothetical protein
MRDAMPDPRLATTRPAASARDADGQCRGIAPFSTPEGAPGMGRGRATWPSVAADAPVARSVVRDADGQAVPRAAPEAVSEDATERAAQAWRLPPALPVAPAGEPSVELIRLLDRLQTTVARYVGERRRAGAPVQRVLPEVRGLVRAAVADEGWYDPGETLMEQAVGWAVAAYYAEPTPSPEAPDVPEGAHVGGSR